MFNNTELQELYEINKDRLETNIRISKEALEDIFKLEDILKKFDMPIKIIVINEISLEWDGKNILVYDMYSVKNLTDKCPAFYLKYFPYLKGFLQF